MSSPGPLVSAAAPLGRIGWTDASPLGRVAAAFVTPGSPYTQLFAHSYADRASWIALAGDRRPRAFDPALAEALERFHRRLGASNASLDHVTALAEGRAFAVVTGQQPGPLGGPLYTWHKVWSAVALARRLSDIVGEPVVPVYWNASEDSDFDEVAEATWAGADLALASASLPREARQEGRLVGSLPAGLAQGVWHAARGAWHDLPGSARAYALLDDAARAAEQGGDLGDVVSRLVLRTFESAGIVVLDPRLPAFRRAALPFYESYLELHAEVRRAVDTAGETIAELGLTPGFTPAQTEFALFEAKGDVRAHLTPTAGRSALARARAARGDDGPGLLPGALLRPLVQDAVLPSLALVAGPGEIGYLAQLAGAAQALDVMPAVVVPRWSATWLPAAAVDALGEAGVTAEDFARDPDAAMREFFARGVPASLSEPLARLRRDAEAAFAALAREAPTLDGSLPELVRATARRVDWRMGKLSEGFARKARRRWKRDRPEGPHLSAYVRPRGALQERTLAWLDVLARFGHAAEEIAATQADRHMAAALDGGALHHDVLTTEAERG